MTETRHDGYDRLLEDFGQLLQEATTRRPPGQRRRRAVAGALMLSGIAAGTLMLAGVGSDGRLDVVAQAKAALAPAGQVVHLVTTSHMEMRGGSQAEIVGSEAEYNTPRVTEQWSTSEPTRWRVVSTVPIVTARGTSSGPVQLSYGGGTEELYVQSLNTLNIRTGVSEDSPRATLSMGTEPVTRIRSMLEAGQLHDAGSGTVDGRTVQRLVGEELQAFNSTLPAPHSPWPVEYDVDPETYAPVRFTVEEVGTSTPGNTEILTLVVDINTYEELPLNENTASLLSIQPIGSHVVTVHHDQGTYIRSTPTLCPRTLRPRRQVCAPASHDQRRTRGRQPPGR